MLGKWLDRLSGEALCALLNTPLAPGEYVREDGIRCVVGAAGGFWCNDDTGECGFERELPTAPHHYGVTVRYDALCERFGTARVNQFVRERAAQRLSLSEVGLIHVGA